jgi:hypothetical protein
VSRFEDQEKVTAKSSGWCASFDRADSEPSFFGRSALSHRRRQKGRMNDERNPWPYFSGENAAGVTPAGISAHSACRPWLGKGHRREQGKQKAGADDSTKQHPSNPLSIGHVKLVPAVGRFDHITVDNISHAKSLYWRSLAALINTITDLVLFRGRRVRISVLLFASFMILIDALRPSGAQQPADPVESSSAPRAKSCGESFSHGSTEEFNKRCIALAGPLAAMRGEALVLRMDDGSRKTFDNKNGVGAAEGGFGYGLADFYPSTHIFVVCDFGVDAGDVKAIDGRTGRELDFGYAIPNFSPDGNWALTAEYGEDGVTASSFAILDARGKKPLTVWTSKASKTRLPAKSSFVAWADDKTIKLASPGQKPVFLIQAADGSWSVGKTSR